MTYVACTRDCFDTCIFKVMDSPSGKRLVPVDKMPTLGFTCARGAGDVKRVYSPKRIKRPLLRGERQTVEASWSRVLEEIAERMWREESERIIHIDYDGNQGLLTWYYPARLFNALKTASTDYSICSSEGHEAIKLHWGRSYGALPSELSKRPVVFWALDASVSFIHGWVLAKRSGKKTAAVDVVWNTTMKNVDIPVLVRPGTDVVLALGVAREIIHRDLYNRDFIERHTAGFEKFRDYVERFTPRLVEEETGVDRETFYKLVELYEERPVSVIGLALSRIENGGDAARAISLLHAVLGDPGGFFYSNSGAWGIDFKYLRGLHISQPSRVVSMGAVGRKIAEFSLVYVWNANPVLTLPQGDKIAEAAARGDSTLVVHSPFFDETAESAHIVLPAPTYLEKEDVVYSYWHNYLVYNRPVFSPMGEARDEVWVVRKLAKLLRLENHPLFVEDPWAAVDNAIKDTGVSVDELRIKGVVELKPPDYYHFPTKSGKVEFYSGAAEERGLPPLPHYRPPPRDRYVLTFTADPRYTNSQFRDIYGEPKPVVYINPDDYVGGCVEIYNEWGSVVLNAVADSSVPRGVVLYVGVGKDLRGSPINVVARGDPGPYGGSPKLYTTYVYMRQC
ncbi:MAG: molybdopterin-dependent oxidoreductase [Pyrobaculum sp.]